ncbi:hypothetical protein [Saccharothrix xinjiangensis]|uniref:Uncharacterized protein n=1 Tax=Saccharothrix xinjiangensis TaxID=204798 RepID=A0ABV9YAB2_9PSEU
MAQGAEEDLSCSGRAELLGGVRGGASGPGDPGTGRGQPTGGRAGGGPVWIGAQRPPAGGFASRASITGTRPAGGCRAEVAEVAAWWWRQARWKRTALLVVAVYVVAVPLNLLIRWALKGWEWHPDLWISALITGSAPAVALPIVAAVQRRVGDRDPGATGRGDAGG